MICLQPQMWLGSLQRPRLFFFCLSATIPAKINAIENATIELASITKARWQLVTLILMPLFAHLIPAPPQLRTSVNREV